MDVGAFSLAGDLVVIVGMTVSGIAVTRWIRLSGERFKNLEEFTVKIAEQNIKLSKTMAGLIATIQAHDEESH